MSAWHEETVVLIDQDNREIDALQQGMQLLIDPGEEVEEGESLIVNDRVCRVVDTTRRFHEEQEYTRLLVKKVGSGGSIDAGGQP